MNIGNRKFRSIWIHPQNAACVQVIDQRALPHELLIKDLLTPDDFVAAIRDMVVRGAPLIGVTAAYGMYSAAINARPDQLLQYIQSVHAELLATRPTATNLRWALDQQLEFIKTGNSKEKMVELALQNANRLAEEDVSKCQSIGNHGLPLIRQISKRKQGDVVNILTHCNAGWLAAVDYGTALAPVYLAHDEGIKIHVWVDETRPRNQGASLTAYELGEHGVQHTVIVDNAGGHLMQTGLVDLVLVGTDRTTAEGDVCNKIGTYLKALAAHDNGIPFYVAVPSSSIDWDVTDVSLIPIEERSQDEVRFVHGSLGRRKGKVMITPPDSPTSNFGFDITPARLVSGLITENGICRADKNAIRKLFPRKK